MDNKLLEEILDTAKRMEKSGTLSVFFENILVINTILLIKLFLLPLILTLMDCSIHQ